MEQAPPSLPAHWPLSESTVSHTCRAQALFPLGLSAFLTAQIPNEEPIGGNPTGVLLILKSLLPGKFQPISKVEGSDDFFFQIGRLGDLNHTRKSSSKQLSS